MEPLEPSEKLEFWRDHVKKLSEFSGTQGEYARQNNLTPSKLSYYKYKFAPEIKPSFTKLVSKKLSDERPTPPVVEKAVSNSKLPDPKWLAAFLRELVR